MIHTYAIHLFGVNERLTKLRRELIEAANAIDRFEEKKGLIDDVLAEMRDVFYVWKSITLSEEMKDAFVRNDWSTHERNSDVSLKAAIDNKLSS